jgi:hypothetical protein
MGGPRHHRRGTAWLAIIALLSNVLTGALGVAFAKASSPADRLLGPLVICTANGAAVAPHDGGTQPGTPGDHCPSCTLIGSLALIGTVAFSLVVFPPPAAPRPAAAQSATPVRHLSLGGIGSRAPPLSA